MLMLLVVMGRRRSRRRDGKRLCYDSGDYYHRMDNMKNITDNWIEGFTIFIQTQAMEGGFTKATMSGIANVPLTSNTLRSNYAIWLQYLTINNVFNPHTYRRLDSIHLRTSESTQSRWSWILYIDLPRMWSMFFTVGEDEAMDFRAEREAEERLRG